MSETTNFGQASLVVRGVGGPSINVTSIRVSNTILSFDSSTGSITANVYDTNGTLIRLSRIPIQIQSATQPASVGPGDEWVCTANAIVFKYTTATGWGALGGYTPPPGAPSSLTAGTPTSTTIPFTWSAPSGTITTYTLTGAGISGGSVTFNYSTNPSSYTLTGLSPGTSYGPFTLTANNTGGGASGASNQVGAVSTILDAPTSLNFTSISTTGFILNWTASSGAASYVLTPTNPSLGQQTVSGTSATYSGLAAYTNYGTITVTPYSGAGGTGTVGTAATSGTAGTVPNPPTGLSATATTSTTATVTFTGSVGGASSYTGGGGGSHSISGTTDTITGLSASTSYTFTVLATGPGGTSTTASANQITTPATAPTAPTSLNFTSISTTGFILNWTASSGAASYVLTPTNPSLGQQTVSGTSATYSGLAAYTNYGTITVTPYSGAGGTGTVGTAATSGTAGTVPNPPTGLSATATTSTTATVTFTGSVGGASSYTGGGGGSHSISGTTDTITGLTGSSTYTFTVYANGTFGTSTTASANQITTPVPAVLYEFQDATFTSGSASVSTGPILSQARSYISGTPAPSSWYDARLEMVTQGIMLWTVPKSAQYTVQIAGARGGYDYYGGNIGRGRIINATLSLVAGQVIKILVGARGGYAYGPTVQGPNPTYLGGGGGGSFIVDANNNPVLIAGGGSGMALGNSGQIVVDAAAYNSTAGTYGNPSGGAPGDNGNTGTRLAYGGNPGAGFYQNAPALDAYTGYPGTSWANGMLGGGNYSWSWAFTGDVSGGFGGGSGGGFHANYVCQGGGGGGYSGGGGNAYQNGSPSSGGVPGGGGNFISGSGLVTVTNVSDGGLNTGGGYVSFIILPAPPPATGTWTISGYTPGNSYYNTSGWGLSGLTPVSGGQLQYSANMSGWSPFYMIFNPNGNYTQAYASQGANGGERAPTEGWTWAQVLAAGTGAGHTWGFTCTRTS